MIRKYSRVLLFVAAPPPLATNTRTVVVNHVVSCSLLSCSSLVFITRVHHSLRLRLHSLRTLGQSSSIYLPVSFIILLSMSAVGIMIRKFLIACGAYPKGTAQRAIKNLLYRVILTPPAASAGRASIDAFGLGGAGGAIVIGTYRRSSGFKMNAYPTDANLSSYAFNFSSRASS